MQEFIASVLVGATMLVGAVAGPFGGNRDFPGRGQSDWPNSGIKEKIREQVGGSINSNSRAEAHAWGREARNRVATSSQATISCIRPAIGAREDALVTAHNALTSAMNAAYAKRATDLKSAYQNSSGGSVYDAVKAANDAFRSSVRSAQQTWKNAQRSSQNTFTSAVKACGGASRGGAGAQGLGDLVNLIKEIELADEN